MNRFCAFHIVSQHLARTLVRNDNRFIDRLIREKQFPVRALLWCLCQRAGGERECDQDQTPAFMGNPFSIV